MTKYRPHERYPGMNQYNRDAMRTAPYGTSLRDELVVCGLGLTGEAGEVADHIKKVLFHGHPLDDVAKAKLVEELGDVLWYIARGALALGVTMDEIASGNVDKLAARYPEGFSPERSMNRAITPYNDMTDAIAYALQATPPREKGEGWSRMLPPIEFSAKYSDEAIESELAQLRRQADEQWESRWGASTGPGKEPSWSVAADGSLRTVVGGVRMEDDQEVASDDQANSGDIPTSYNPQASGTDIAAEKG